MRASVWSCVAYFVVVLLTQVFGLGPIDVGLLATANAQQVPKSLEEGGSDAALRVRKNTWTVGVAVTGWLVEATGTYGAGLLRYMQNADVEVLEVTTPDTHDRHKRGKNDDLDHFERFSWVGVLGVSMECASSHPFERSGSEKRL